MSRPEQSQARGSTIRAASMRAIWAVLVLVLTAGPSGVFAEGQNETLALLILRVLAYDRNLPKRAGKGVVVAIV